MPSPGDTPQEQQEKGHCKLLGLSVYFPFLVLFPFFLRHFPLFVSFVSSFLLFVLFLVLLLFLFYFPSFFLSFLLSFTPSYALCSMAEGQLDSGAGS